MSLYKTVYPISHRLDRIEKGAVIDLTEDEAFNLADAVVPFVDESAAPVVEEVEPAIEDMTLDQLKAKATALGLKTTGSKADLTERITLHLSGEEAGA
jgi:hypothetical protein